MQNVCVCVCVHVINEHFGFRLIRLGASSPLSNGDDDVGDDGWPSTPIDEIGQVGVISHCLLNLLFLCCFFCYGDKGRVRFNSFVFLGRINDLIDILRNKKMVESDI